jgi:hypothetical protein
MKKNNIIYGFLFGGLFYIILQILFFLVLFIGESFSVLFLGALLNYPALIVNSEYNWINFAFNLIFYIIIGGLIGFIVSKFKSIKK